MRAARFLTACLLVGSLLAIMPQARATNADWAAEYAAHVGDSVREIALDHDGERLGMAYKYTSTAGVGFNIRTAAGVWTQQNAAVIAAASDVSQVKLLNSGSGKWIVAGLHTGTSNLDLFHSQDDGITWTQAVGLGGSGTYDLALIASGEIGLVSCEGAAGLKYRHSTDNGATWSAGFRLDDNVGNPASATATAIGCQGSDVNAGVAATLTGGNDGNAYAIFNSANGDGLYYVHSSGGDDQFWTVPFYNGGACPSGCGPVDGATNRLIYAAPTGGVSVYGVDFAHNGDLVHTTRNALCTTVSPNTLKVASTYLGNPPTDNSGSTCNNYNPAGTFQKISTATGCAAFGKTQYDRIAGNSAHTFIAALGHSTLCGGVGFEVSAKSGFAGAWANTFTDPSQTIVFDVDMTATKAYAAFVDTTAGGQVKVVYASSPTAAGGQIVDYTLPTAQNLAGLDVDVSGANLIYTDTHSGTRFAYTMPAQTLASVIASVDTGCNRLEGATIAKHNALYSHCTVSSSVDSLQLRSAGLSTPSQTATCNSHALGQSWGAGLTGITPLQTFVFGSIDFEVHLFDENANCWTTAGLIFEDTDGKIGFEMLTLKDDGTQLDLVARTQFVANGNLAGGTALCEPANAGGTGDDFYLLAVDQNQPTNTYALHTDPQGPSIALQQTGSGALGSANAVACNGNTTANPALLAAQGKVYGYQYRTGATQWTHSDLTPVSHGVAESWDGRYGVICCDASNNLVVINTATGATLGTEPLPGYAVAGDVFDVITDGTAQSLWVGLKIAGQDDHILKYDIHALTTVLPQAPGEVVPGLNETVGCQVTNTCPTTSTTTTGGGGLGGGVVPGITGDIAIYASMAVIIGFAILGVVMARRIDGGGKGGDGQ